MYNETTMSDILVTAKVHPDLDGTACTLAYSDLLRKLGNDAEGCIFGSPQSEVSYFVKKHKIILPKKAVSWYGGWSKYVLVDASSKQGMPKCIKNRDVIEVIDHRKSEPEKEFPNAKIQNELIGAAATIIVERFREKNIEINLKHALLLYGAIHHNTLNFISSNTTSRDKQAVAFLQNTYDLPENMPMQMFEYATKEIEANVDLALKNDAKEFGKGCKIGACQLVVWDSGVLKKKDFILPKVVELAKKLNAEWAFLNVINLATAESILYVTSDLGQNIIEKALNISFDDKTAVLRPALLRKQMMPKINQILEENN